MMKIKTVLILAVMALFTIAICSIGQDVPKQTAPSTSEEQVAPESDMPYMCSMQDMGMGAGGCCGMGPCRGYGQGPVAPPGCGCCMGPGMGPGMGCGM